MATATKTKRTATTTATWTAKQIAEMINSATTPSEKGTATRRMKAYIANRASEGACAERVEKNIQSLAKRLRAQ